MRVRPFLLPLAGLILFAGASALSALPASANNASTGSGGAGSSMSGGGMMSSQPLGATRGRSVVSMRRSPFGNHEFGRRDDFGRTHGFRRFHHHRRDLLAESFFPWGFGWPLLQSDFPSEPIDASDEADWRSLPFWRQFDRYQPPTVEKSPSGVTIIRGPGSHHGLSP